MLDAIRQRAASWVVKVLLLMLVVSFAIWGIGDIFYGGGQNPTVATVGDSEITAMELDQAFVQAVNNLQRRIGTAIDRDQAVQMGVMQQALQDLIRRRLLDLRAREMGLTVADETLRSMITDNPMFQTAGQFDRSRFDQLLLTIGLNEDGYLARLRQDVVRATLTRSLAAPVTVPETLADALFRYRNEERRGEYALIASDSVTDLPEPTDDDLQAYHAANEQLYTTPELRQLTLVTLEAEDLIDEVDVGDDRIEAAYQDRMETYRTPERRTVEQLLVSDRAVAEQAEERIAEGASFAELVTELGDSDLAVESLGEVARGDLPEAFEEAIFDLAEGEVSAPVESPFGWHLFRVESVLPEEVVPLADVRDDLARELALVEARDRLPTFAAQLDDELAGGASLADAAAALGLSPRTLPPVDRSGRDADGAQPDSLPPWSEVLQVAFETPAGELSLLEETEAGAYFVLQVEEVLAPRLQTVDEVRDELVAAWQQERRGKLARERAEALREESATAGDLHAVAEAEGLDVVTVGPTVRGGSAGTDPALVRALFATEPGSIADEVVVLPAGVAIVATTEVIAAQPGDDPDAVEQLSAELQDDLAADLLAQFEARLRDEYPVEIDAAEVGRLMRIGAS